MGGQFWQEEELRDERSLLLVMNLQGKFSEFVKKSLYTK